MVTVCVDSPVERNIRETVSGVGREGPVVIMKRCVSKIENRSDRKDALACGEFTQLKRVSAVSREQCQKAPDERRRRKWGEVTARWKPPRP